MNPDEIDQSDRGNPLAAISDEPEAIDEFYRRNELMVLDEKEVARTELREIALRQMDGFWKRGLRVLAQYDGNRNMALDCFILALGQGEMIGMHTAVEVAVKHFADRNKRAAVTKVIKLFQDCLNIPPMPGQRGEKGRVEMGKARNGQLK